MQKCIIISVRPEWVEKILNGKKTIEIRKSMPKCDYPIDVYIYCTKAKSFDEMLSIVERNNRNFVKENYGIDTYYYGDDFGNPYLSSINGKIVAKFTLNKVSNVIPYLKSKSNGKTYIQYISDCGDVTWRNQTCLEQLDFEHYLGLKSGYAWHIDNLVIFDKTMELSDFYRNNFDEDKAKPCNCGKSCKYDGYDLQENQRICGIDYDGQDCPFLKFSRPPQSWCYAWR